MCDNHYLLRARFPPPSPEQVSLDWHIITPVSCTLRPILHRYPGEGVDRCPYVRYIPTRYPVPDPPFLSPPITPVRAPGPFRLTHILGPAVLDSLALVWQTERSCRLK